VGEVVSSDRIDEDLPDSSVLVIYDMERTGDIDNQEVRSEGREIIKTERNQIANQLQSQVVQGDVEINDNKLSLSGNSEVVEESTDPNDGNDETTGDNGGVNTDSDSEAGEQGESTSSGSETERSDQSSDSTSIGQLISDIISDLF
jgi:hypothetical protein